MYVTSDGGSNWNQVPGASIPNPLGGEYGYTRQIEVVGNDVWFSTNRGRIYYSSDQGNNWVVYQSPISDFGSAEVNGSLSFSDSQNGIIIDNSANVYRTFDGGSNWSQISTTGNIYTSGLCFIEGTDTVFSTGGGAGNNGGGSSFSLDGGYTWAPIDIAPHLFVDFYSPELGWSGGFTQVQGPDSTGGVWKWEDLSLGIDFNETDFRFNYFPNPTEDYININYEGNLSISVYDMLGKEILKTNDKLINMKGFENGVYIFKIHDIVKQKSKSIRILKK